MGACYTCNQHIEKHENLATFGNNPNQIVEYENQETIKDEGPMLKKQTVFTFRKHEASENAEEIKDNNSTDKKYDLDTNIGSAGKYLLLL